MKLTQKLGVRFFLLGVCLQVGCEIRIVWRSRHLAADACAPVVRSMGSMPFGLRSSPEVAGLLPASCCPAYVQGEWEKMLGWAAEHCAGKWTKCRKLLSVLAWHLSMRQVCRKEMVRCIRCGKLVRQAQGALRAAARQLP